MRFDPVFSRLKKFKKLEVVKFTPDFQDAVAIKNRPIMAPHAAQVRVKVVYVGVNSSDINITAGQFCPEQVLPIEVGFEALGIVDAVGESVTGFKLGQVVLYFNFSLEVGAYAQFIYASPDELILIPECKPEYLGALVCGLKASIGLDLIGHIKPGDKVLVTAAAGPCGLMAVQWAKSKGCYVVGITSSEDRAKMLKKVGCDKIINYKINDLGLMLKKDFPKGIDVIWETMGGQILSTLSDHLAVRGRMIILRSGRLGSTDCYDVNELSKKLLMKSQSVTGFSLLTCEKELIHTYAKKLVSGICLHKFNVNVDMGENYINYESEDEVIGPGMVINKAGKMGKKSFYGLEDIAKAVDYLHSGRARGKVVVQIHNRSDFFPF